MITRTSVDNVKCQLIVTLFVLVFHAVAIRGQEPEVSQRVDRQEIQVADPFHVEYRIVAESGCQIDFPTAGKQTGPFDVLQCSDRRDVPLDDEIGRREWVRFLTLETIETGQLSVPALNVEFTNTNKDRQTITFDAIVVRVLSSLEEGADVTKFNDVRDVVDSPTADSNNPTLVWIGWGIGGSLLMIGFCLVLIASRRKTWISPAQWAIRKLNQTTDWNYTDRTMRIFLEREFGFPASHLPWNEIISKLKSLGAREPDWMQLQDFFQKSEQIRFAGKLPTDRPSALSIELAALIERLELTNLVQENR